MAEPIDVDWPSLDVMTARYLALVMDHVANNRTHAARLLGINRRTIVRMLARREAGGAIFHPAPRETQKRNRAPRVERELVREVRPAASSEVVRVVREQEARTMATQASWDEIQVWAFGDGTLEGLDGDRRLAALYEWRAGRGKRSVWFTRSAREITAADEVDWTRFPEDRARQAALSPAS